MLANQSSRIYLDDLDVGGLINALSDRVIGSEDQPEQPYYQGALQAIELIRFHQLRTQADFMQLFDLQLQRHLHNDMTGDFNNED